jgi:hypothetical protein
MMFGQQPYVYQQPIYNQPPMMQEPMMRSQYQLTPQYPAPQPQPQQSGGQAIIWVPNEKAANEFIVAPNNAVTLWDMNAPVVYVKKADASGKPAMTTYDLVERSTAPVSPTVPQTVPTVEYVTRKDFDELAAKVAALSVKPVRKVKEADNESSV